MSVFKSEVEIGANDVVPYAGVFSKLKSGSFRPKKFIIEQNDKYSKVFVTYYDEDKSIVEQYDGKSFYKTAKSKAKQADSIKTFIPYLEYTQFYEQSGW